MKAVNTAGKFAGQSKDCVIVLEELEFAFTYQQLQEITELWNIGTSLSNLEEKFKRPAVEILLALMHQARNKKIKRPFAAQI